MRSSSTSFFLLALGHLLIWDSEATGIYWNIYDFTVSVAGHRSPPSPTAYVIDELVLCQLAFLTTHQGVHKFFNVGPMTQSGTPRNAAEKAGHPFYGLPLSGIAVISTMSSSSSPDTP